MLKKHCFVYVVFFVLLFSLVIAHAQEQDIYEAKNINQYINFTENYESPEILSVNKNNGEVNNNIAFEQEFDTNFNKYTVADDLEDLNYTIIDETKNVYTVIQEYALCRLLVLSENIANTYGATSGVSYGGFTVLKYNDSFSTEQAYNCLIKDYGVDNVVVDTLSTCEAAGWGTTHMKLDKKLSSIQYPNSTTVAVVDSGINSSHEIFKNITISNKSKSFIDNSISDSYNHGTAVAGIISENATSKTTLLILKVVKSDGTLSVITAMQAIQYAIENNADVINCSFGSLQGSTTQKAYDQVFKLANNSIIVAASGNENKNMSQHDVKYYPSSSAYTIGVGSIDKQEKRSSFSNYGDDLDFVAPGQSLSLASVNGKYYTGEGTSFAAPYISASVNLLKAENKALKLSNVISELKTNCKDLGASGKDRYYGNGLPIFSNASEITEINPTVVLKSSKFSYTGKSINPIKSVTYKGKNIGYTTSYPKGNKDIGKKNIVINILDSRYTGTVTKEFTICPETPKVPYRVFKNGIVHLKYNSLGSTNYEIYASTSGIIYQKYTTSYPEYLINLTGSKATRVYIKIRGYTVVNGVKYFSEYKDTLAIKGIDFK